MYLNTLNSTEMVFWYYSDVEQIGSLVVNNAGVFMDWYDVKSYHDFFETTSSYSKQN